MKRIFFLFCMLLLAAPAVTSQIVEPDKRNQPAPQSTWQTYTVKGEDFSVSLPTLPAMTTHAVFHSRTQKYRVERHLNTSLDGVVYSIDVFENPEPGESLEDF